MSPRFPPSVADLYLIIWALAWDTHALLTAPWRLFHANIFYPSTLSLAYSEHFLGFVPLFAIPYLVTRNPILAVNLTLYATYPLCAIATYLLARRWVGAPAAAVAGFFDAFCLWRYTSLPHLHMLGVEYLPIVLLLTERWLDRARTIDGLLLAAALVLQALSSVYLASALILVYVPYLLIALVRRRRELDGRRLFGLFLATATVAGAFALSSIPYAFLRWLDLIPSYGAGGPETLGLVPILGAQSVWQYLTKEGVGVVGYALALVAIVRARRGPRWPITAGLLLALIGIVAAFGPAIPIRGRPVWSPYRLLLDHVPPFTTIRLPSRFVVVAQLGFALLAGVGFDRLAERVRPAVAWAGAIATMALAVASFGAFPALPLRAERADAAVPEAYRWLATNGAGRPLLELPEDNLAAAERMVFSTYHWLPIVDGYSGYAPATSRYLHGIARRLPDEDALQEIVDRIDLGWILVHRADLDPASSARWDGTLPPGLERAEAWGQDLLLRVDRPVKDDRRARFLSWHETLGGVPIEPLGALCPGELRLVQGPPSPWPPRSTARIAAEATNTGRRAWPALGFYPRHLVRLRTRIEDGTGWFRHQDVELPDDVLPDRPVTAGLDLVAPPMPREYTLVIELVQVEDGSLSRCGVKPLRIPFRVGQPPA